MCVCVCVRERERERERESVCERERERVSECPAIPSHLPLGREAAANRERAVVELGAQAVSE